MTPANSEKYQFGYIQEPSDDLFESTASQLSPEQHAYKEFQEWFNSLASTLEGTTMEVDPKALTGWFYEMFNAGHVSLTFQSDSNGPVTYGVAQFFIDQNPPKPGLFINLTSSFLGKGVIKPDTSLEQVLKTLKHYWGIYELGGETNQLFDFREVGAKRIRCQPIEFLTKQLVLPEFRYAGASEPEGTTDNHKVVELVELNTLLQDTNPPEWAIDLERVLKYMEIGLPPSKQGLVIASGPKTKEWKKKGWKTLDIDPAFGSDVVGDAYKGETFDLVGSVDTVLYESFAFSGPESIKAAVELVDPKIKSGGNVIIRSTIISKHNGTDWVESYNPPGYAGLGSVENAISALEDCGYSVKVVKESTTKTPGEIQHFDWVTYVATKK